MVGGKILIQDILTHNYAQDVIKPAMHAKEVILLLIVQNVLQLHNKEMIDI